MTTDTEALPPHPSHATVRDWMPVSEALRLADLWTVGDLNNSGQWRAAIKVLADETRAALAQRQQVPEFEQWWEKHGQFCRAGGGDYEKTFAFRAWEAALAQRQQVPELPPIERDEHMDRTYIPLPGGWEVQTKGKGSTFRLCDTKSGDRWPVLDYTGLHEALEQMAREIRAAITAAPPAQPSEPAAEAQEPRTEPRMWWKTGDDGEFLMSPAVCLPGHFAMMVADGWHPTYDTAQPSHAQQVTTQPRLTVRVQSFPESNGKRNWTALLMRVDPWGGLVGNCGGITIARGEFWNRVAYEAECARALLGERDTEPFILDYGDDITTPDQWAGEVRGGRPVRELRGADAAEPKCSPTLTECPRCKNVISKCDGILAATPSASPGASSSRFGVRPNRETSMATKTIGERIEDWKLYGMPESPLDEQEREAVIDFAIGFEECSHSREALQAMSDAELVGAAYWAMADYARGQM